MWLVCIFPSHENLYHKKTFANEYGTHAKHKLGAYISYIFMQYKSLTYRYGSISHDDKQ